MMTIAHDEQIAKIIFMPFPGRPKKNLKVVRRGDVIVGKLDGENVVYTNTYTRGYFPGKASRRHRETILACATLGVVSKDGLKEFFEKEQAAHIRAARLAQAEEFKTYAKACGIKLTNEQAKAVKSFCEAQK